MRYKCELCPLENCFSNFTQMPAPQTQIFQGMFDPIIHFTPGKFHVKLLTFMLFEINFKKFALYSTKAVDGQGVY